MTKKPTITWTGYLALFSGALTILLFIVSLILPIYQQFMILAPATLLLIFSSYFIYVTMEQFTSNKLMSGGILISIALSLFMYSSSQVLILLNSAEEISIAWRFRMLKGITGKETIPSDNGYVVKYNQPPGARKDIKIIGIKTETIDALKGQWPIDWKYYAKIIKIFKESSNILFFDIFFLDPKPIQTEAMLKELEGSTNVLLDYPVETTLASKEKFPDIQARHEVLRKFKLVNVVDEGGRGIPWLKLAVPPLSTISQKVAGLGFANIKKEDNTSNRKMPLVVKLEEHGPKGETEFYPSIDLLTVAKYYGIDVVNDTEIVMGKYVKLKNIPEKKLKDIIAGTEYDIMNKPNSEREITIPIDYYGQMEINFVGSLYSFRDEDLYEVSTEWTENEVANFENTIFLVAMYYATGINTAKDTHLSPYGEMSGIEHHAHAINTILNQDFVSNSSKGIDFLAFLILGLAVGVAQSKLQTKTSFLVFLSGVILYTAINMYLFDKWSYILPLPAILMNMLFIFVSITGYKIFAEEENVKYIRNTFSKFVSKDIVDELLKDPDKIALGGARREITVFFSDVRGFTTISESLSPEELVQLLNEYLSAMTDSIIEMKGTIDKYMGDAIMAFWGAPVPLEDHAYYGCVTALIQLEKLKGLQESWKRRNLPSIDIGIGLNSGPAVVGNMGSSHRMDYTCMGDTVNLGSRLEGSNKMYGTRIIISEYTYEKVKERVYARELDLVQVKGKTHPVRIYELLGLVNDADFGGIQKRIA